MPNSITHGTHLNLRIASWGGTFFETLRSKGASLLRHLQSGRSRVRFHALPEYQLKDLGLRRDMLERERRLDD